MRKTFFFTVLAGAISTQLGSISEAGHFGTRRGQQTCQPATQNCIPCIPSSRMPVAAPNCVSTCESTNVCGTSTGGEGGMSPQGFPRVSSSAPFGRDPMDGAALTGPPVTVAEVRSATSTNVDDAYRLRDIILELLQQKQPGLTKGEAEAFIEQAKFKNLKTP
jgi:hypothetical protein